MGILDDFSGFIKTPEGMGLLSAAFGGMAGARPGARLNNIGRAGMSGLMGYSHAQDQQMQLSEAEQMKQMRDFQIQDIQRKQAEDEATRQAFTDAYQSPGAQAISMGGNGPTNEAAAMIPYLKPKVDVNSALDNLMKVNPILAMKMKQSMTPEPIKLGAEESLLDPTTYKPIATGMGKTPSLPSAIQEYNFSKGQGYKGTFQDYQLEQKKAGASNVTTTVMPPQKLFENEDKLRDNYRSEPMVKNAAEMQNAFNVIETAYKTPSAANDLAMATKYMKVLDPTSVVRESEFALAINATGLLDKVYNYAHAVATGQRLNPTQRKDFYDSAKAINESFQAEKATVGESYKKLATQYGFKPENVIFQPSGSKKIQSTGTIDFSQLRK